MSEPAAGSEKASGSGPRPTMRYRIADALRAQIVAGDFAPGEELPSMRDLAEQWQVVPNTVAAAFDVLNTEGLIMTAAGHRARVATGRPRTRPSREVTQRLKELRATEAGIKAAQARISELAGRRRALIAGLHESGMTYADIGVAAGITRIRLSQIVAAGLDEKPAATGRAAAR